MFLRLYILSHCIAEDFTGSNSESETNSYARNGSKIRLFFQVSEFILLFEVFHYLAEIQDMKVHLFTNICSANFMLFFVIDYNRTVSEHVIQVIE